MQTELKPCPFCGGDIRFVHPKNFWAVFHSKIGCILFGIIGFYESKKSAREAWNRRTP